jgi:hypothetical protein
MIYPHQKMSMRNYKKEYENYHSRPEQKVRRAARNAARRCLKDKTGIKGKDVHHKDNNPLNNDKSNLSIVTQNYNRKEPRLREKKLKEWLEAADIQEAIDVKKALSKVKGLTKKQIQSLQTLPQPALIQIVQQLSGLVMGEVKEYMQTFEEEMGTVTGPHIAGTGDDSSTVIVRKKKKMLKRMRDTMDYNKKGGHVK